MTDTLIMYIICSCVDYLHCLQEHTLVGRPDAPKQPDIQLSGLGVAPEHAVIDVEDNDVYITPIDGARYTWIF